MGTSFHHAGNEAHTAPTDANWRPIPIERMETGMHHFSVRRRAVVVAGLACTAILAGCEDKRLTKLHAGMTKDSVLTVLAQNLRAGSGPDSLPNVYLAEQYVLDGKNYTVWYYTPNNEKAAKDTVPFKKLTPLVLVNYRLAGTGWGLWDSVSRANKIPLKQH